MNIKWFHDIWIIDFDISTLFNIEAYEKIINYKELYDIYIITGFDKEFNSKFYLTIKNDAIDLLKNDLKNKKHFNQSNNKIYIEIPNNSYCINKKKKTFEKEFTIEMVLNQIGIGKKFKKIVPIIK